MVQITNAGAGTMKRGKERDRISVYRSELFWIPTLIKKSHVLFLRGKKRYVKIDEYSDVCMKLNIELWSIYFQPHCMFFSPFLCVPCNIKNLGFI